MGTDDGPVDNKIALKDQIVSETIKILSLSGIEGLSLREVAKRLNVTHQAPYHYFADKSVLLLEVKRQGFAQLSERMQAKVGQTQAPPFDSLKQIGYIYINFCLENPGLFRAMFAPHQEGQNIRVSEAAVAFEIVKSSIVRLQAQGYLKGFNAEIQAMICWTSLHGLVSLAIDKYPILGGQISIEELSDQMMSQLHRLMGE